MHIEIANDNVKIMVKFSRMWESSLTEKYDYITLIGVFEYSQGYIGTAQLRWKCSDALYAIWHWEAES